MANYKMYPGSKEKNTPGGTSEKQTFTAKKLFNTIVKSVGLASGLGPAMALGKKASKAFKKGDIKKANRPFSEVAIEAIGGISGAPVGAAGKTAGKARASSIAGSETTGTPPSSSTKKRKTPRKIKYYRSGLEKKVKY